MTEKKSSQKTKKTTSSPQADAPTLTQTIEKHFATDPTLELSIPWEKVKDIYNKTIQGAARHIKQAGFRPGKVPASVAKDKLDQNYLIQETLRQIAPDVFAAELKKHPEIKLFVEPELVIKKAQEGSDWEVTAHIPQKPEIKLPDYQKILAESKKKIIAELEKEQKEKAAQATKDKQAYTVPSKDQIRAQATDKALFALLEKISPQVSPIIVRRSTQKEFERFQKQLEQNQIKLDDYLKSSGQNLELIGQQLTHNALQNLQLEFILDALMEAEKITADEAEIAAKIPEIFPHLSSEAEQKAQLKDPQVSEYVTLITRRKKLADWLLSL